MAEVTVEKKINYAHELLSVTNAAIQALDKPNSSFSSSKSSVNSQASAPRIEHSADSAHNSSTFSDVSCKNGSGAESFISLTGQAKVVKVKRKQLREIRTPFSDEEPINISGTHLSDLSSLNHSGKIKESYSYPDQTRTTNESYSRLQNEKSQGKLGDAKEEAGVVDARPMLDSGYMTQNIQIIREIDQQSLHEEQNNSGHHDVFEAQSQDSSNLVSDVSDHSNIVTVPEKIVTVNARSAESIDNGSEHNSSTSTANGLDPQSINFKARLSKYHPTVLKQGSVVQEGTSINPMMQRDGEIQISQFHLSEKEKMLKKNFIKRHTEVGAVKKTVQPKLVQPRVIQPTVETQKKSESEAVTAAAIAAASAVAATQPFLQAQHEMDQRLAAIVQQLSTVSQVKNPGNKDELQDRLDHLEDKVASLTHQRLDNLEKMQQHQMDCQAHLLAISRQRPPDFASTAGSQHYGHNKDTLMDSSGHWPGHAMPYMSTGMGGSQTSLHDKEEILDTPAPRKRPPRPTAYNKTSPTRSQHLHSPEHQAKKGGGLLAEILASQEETPKGPFPVTPPSRASRNRLR